MRSQVKGELSLKLRLVHNFAMRRAGLPSHAEKGSNAEGCDAEGCDAEGCDAEGCDAEAGTIEHGSSTHKY